jgi:hypothetical protein
VSRAVLVILLATLACGCGEHRLKAAPATPAAPAARMLVTTGFGARVLHDVRVAPGQTVMAATETAATVATSYGGRYVQSIDGIAGSLDRGEDWLYFVDGVEGDVGAADTGVRAGDVVWWDYRRWTSYMHVPVVVGAWPEPFVHRYAASGVAADPPLAAPLARAGARLDAAGPCRVLVGTAADVARRSPAWRAAQAGPQGAGLTAWVAGGRIMVWDARSQAARAVPDGRAVAAAVSSGSCATMVVAGLDEAAAEAAARRVATDPASLAHRYAVVFSASGVPIAYGGAG